MHLREVDANLLVTLDALLVDASVTRAAERLGRSASAISHALAKLREIFADELFVRAGQKLVPTAKAMELAPTVHVILAGMESLLRPNKPFDPSDSLARFRRGRERGGRAHPAAAAPPAACDLRRRACASDWMPSHREENIDALRNGRCHFVIDIEGGLAPAPDIRVLKLFDDTLVTLARQKHPLAKRKVKAELFAAADHIEVNSLPALEFIDGALGADKLACNVSSRVSSVLVGLLLALNNDVLLTLPASLGSIHRAAIRTRPRSTTLRSDRLPVKANVAFKLRPRRMP